MPVFKLDATYNFPPTSLSDEDGLLAFGGDLSTLRLIEAYSLGIFPWYNEGEPIQWWSPPERFVIHVNDIHISKSMKRMLKSTSYRFALNENFSKVIKHCKSIDRKGQAGTWITNEMLDAYTQLHYCGYAHSAECYCNNQLVGGLYGVLVGRVFSGESMFSLKSNASKYALIKLAEYLMSKCVSLIDCQMYTPHLESMGGKFMDRSEFELYLL